MPTINMLSSAEKVRGHGVSSAYVEQIKLVEKGMSDTYRVMVNRWKLCDIMHYHTIDFKHYLAVPIARTKGVNVGYVHFLPETIDGSIKLPVFARKSFYSYIISFYKSMDYLVTVNPYFIKKLAKYGIPPDKVTFIPNYVSEDKFYPYDQERRMELRDRYGIARDSFVVLGAGQVQTRKGVVDFIRVAESLPHISFIWAGGFSFGHLTDGYRNLKKIVENPPPNVRFTGIVERDAMNELYNIADLMFLPSYNELFPMTVLEAFNCRVPVLLRDLEIYKGIFFDFYLKGNNVKDFCGIIEQLSGSRELCEKWREQSWKGHGFYCESHVLSLWKDFYDRVYREYTLHRSARRYLRSRKSV